MALAVAGCGSGGSDSSASSSDSGSGLATYAPPGSVVFAEGDLEPSGEEKANVNSVANALAGVKDLRSYVASKLEKAAREDGEQLNFASEVEPWLGERAGVAFEHLEGGELSEPVIAVESTNTKATQAFVKKHTAESKSPYKGASYQGVEFEVGGSEANAVGVIGEALVLADSEKDFKAAIDATKGDSLADEERFQQAISAASKGSFADVYFDVGGILDQSGEQIDSQTREVLEGAGIDPSDATAVASVIPQSEQLQVDLSSELGGGKAPTGDASDLLGSLPAGSVAAAASAGFGEQFEEAVNQVDESGIPPELKPGELKDALSQAGIDIDKVAASLEDAAIFLEGSDRSDLGGAMVVTAQGSEAAQAVAGLGRLLRGAGVPGLTAVSGKASGFSLHSPTLGSTPIVVVAEGSRIAIGYGLASALKALAGEGATLSGTASYKAAVKALGSRPISAFVDGPAALKLAEALFPRSNKDFWEVQPYLKNVSYVGVSQGKGEEPTTAKLIAGFK